MDRPKLRKVDRFEHNRGAESLLVVRDPLGLAEPFALNADLAPVLELLDGSKTVPQIRQSLMMTKGLNLDREDLDQFVAELREAGLLDDDHFRDRWAQAHSDFLDAPVRPATLAGLVYPAEPGPLAALLERMLPSSTERTAATSSVAGVLVPHGSIETLGPLLDQTLRGLPDPASIEHIVILGTDHGPGLLPYAVTDKPYATPLGASPVASDLLGALERRVPWIMREQMRHREAISIELATVVLLHLFGDRCPPILPVLCGSTALSDPDGQQSAEQFELALGALCEDRPVLWWVSAELTHGGPAYGRPEITNEHREHIGLRDADLLTALRTGDDARIVDITGREHPQGPPSGGATLASAARMLPTGYRGQLVDHAILEAPGETPGAISVAGMRLHLHT